jgi:CheY-like chemotaxis protein
MDFCEELVPIVVQDERVVPMRMNILVVEDDLFVANAVCELIEVLGYDCHLAVCGAAALAYLRAGHPVSLVFSDILMPEMNGIELGTVVHTEFPKIPVILTTGYAEMADLAKWTGLPILQKPYGMRQLNDALAEALNPGT